MLPRVRCVPCLSTVACLPLKSHFYATTLSFIPFVLLRLACEVGLETMAALDGQPFLSMVHVVIACWGCWWWWWGANRPAYVLCVWSHLHSSKHGEGKVSVGAALAQTKTMRRMKRWHPPVTGILVKCSFVFLTRSLSASRLIKDDSEPGHPRGPLRSHDPSSGRRPVSPGLWIKIVRDASECNHVGKTKETGHREACF